MFKINLGGSKVFSIWNDARTEVWEIKQGKRRAHASQMILCAKILWMERAWPWKEPRTNTGNEKENDKNVGREQSVLGFLDYDTMGSLVILWLKHIKYLCSIYKLNAKISLCNLWNLILVIYYLKSNVIDFSYYDRCKTWRIIWSSNENGEKGKNKLWYDFKENKKLCMFHYEIKSLFYEVTVCFFELI